MECANPLLAIEVELTLPSSPNAPLILSRSKLVLKCGDIRLKEAIGEALANSFSIASKRIGSPNALLSVVGAAARGGESKLTGGDGSEGFAAVQPGSARSEGVKKSSRTKLRNSSPLAAEFERVGRNAAPDERLFRLVPPHQGVSIATLRDEHDCFGGDVVDESSEGLFVSFTLELMKAKGLSTGRLSWQLVPGSAHSDGAKDGHVLGGGLSIRWETP